MEKMETMCKNKGMKNAVAGVATFGLIVIYSVVFLGSNWGLSQFGIGIPITEAVILNFMFISIVTTFKMFKTIINQDCNHKRAKEIIKEVKNQKYYPKSKSKSKSKKEINDN